MALNTCVYNGVELTPPFLVSSSFLLGLNHVLQDIRPRSFTYTQYLLAKDSHKNLVMNFLFSLQQLTCYPGVKKKSYSLCFSWSTVMVPHFNPARNPCALVKAGFP